MKRLSKNNYKFFQLIWFVLDKGAKKKMVLALILVVINSFLDFLGLASIIPAVLALKDPQIILRNPYLYFIYEGLGFLSTNLFVLALLVSIFIFFLVKSLASIAIVRYNTIMICDISTKLSKRILSIIFNKSLIYVRNQNSSNLYRQINSYPTLFGTHILTNTLNLISETIVVTFIFVSILVYNYKVFLIIAFFILPVVYFFNIRYRKLVKEIGYQSNRESIGMLRVFQNIVHGFVDIKMFNREAFYEEVLVKITNKVNKLSATSLTLSLIPARILELNAIFVLIIIYLTTFLMPMSNEAVFTIISFFIIAAYRVMPSTSKIIQATLSIKGTSYSLIFLYKLLKQNSEQSYEDNEIVFNHRISLNLVNLQYFKSGKFILKDFNLVIKKGEMVGIVGESGAGKSSLINLLLGFVEPVSGSVMIDEQVLTPNNIRSWRSRIGYVKQDTFLFDGTIAENVAIGENIKDIDKNKVIECLNRSHLSSFLSDQKDGVESPVGEMGGKVSGGQKQRIGIARAIYKNPAIVIFDEATSALDIQTEAEIVNEIKELKSQSLSVVIIAHRHTNLKHCDRILKMVDGSIAQSFTSYEDFIKSNRQ